MPAILTHDFFGRDAWPGVASSLGLPPEEGRAAFLLGNQGPDPLFYLAADPRARSSRRVGELMHRDQPSGLLAALRDAVDALPRTTRHVGRAYAAGFLCHYLLDSSVHPLVFSMQHALCGVGVEGLGPADGSLVHAEIERDLDEMVLYAKTGLTVLGYRPYREVLMASRDVLGTADALFVAMCAQAYDIRLDAGTYVRAVRAFRRVQRLFWQPSAGRREALGLVERVVTRSRYSLLCAMAHRPRAEGGSDFDNRAHAVWRHPFLPVVATDSFWDLYDQALARVAGAEAALFGPGFGLAGAAALTRGLNFSGEPVVEEWPVGDVDG